VAGLPLYLLVMMYPEWVLGIFGPGYTEAALLLQILATGQFINLVTGPVELALTMSAFETANLRLTIGASSLSMIGLLVLVPNYAAVGVAFAVGGAIAVHNLAPVV